MSEVPRSLIQDMGMPMKKDILPVVQSCPSSLLYDTLSSCCKFPYPQQAAMWEKRGEYTTWWHAVTRCHKEGESNTGVSFSADALYLSRCLVPPFNDMPLTLRFICTLGQNTFLYGPQLWSSLVILDRSAPLSFIYLTGMLWVKIIAFI